MKHAHLQSLLALALLAGMSPAIHADEGQKGKTRNPHDQLKRVVGNWTTEMSSYYPDPKNPTITKGRASYRMILGGKFVQQRFFGEVGGQKYEGIGISGYDTAKKKFIGTWKDSLNTGIMHMEGTYDVKTHTLTEAGEMSTPQGIMKTKNTTKYVDKDHFVFTMYMVTPEGEQKAFSIAYSRAKGKAKPKKESKKKKD